MSGFRQPSKKKQLSSARDAGMKVAASFGKPVDPPPSPGHPPAPTPKQKRQIISMLEDVYDDDAKRYKGDDTDKTVAEVLEDGIRSGWVAAIREEMFGPDGGNEEMESLQVEMTAWLEQANRDQQECEKILKTLAEGRASIREFQSRLDRIAKNVGPKGGTP